MDEKGTSKTIRFFYKIIGIFIFEKSRTFLFSLEYNELFFGKLLKSNIGNVLYLSKKLLQFTLKIIESVSLINRNTLYGEKAGFITS